MKSTATLVPPPLFLIHEGGSKPYRPWQIAVAVSLSHIVMTTRSMIRIHLFPKSPSHSMVLYGRRNGLQPVVGLLPLDAGHLESLHADPDSPRPAVQWIGAPSWVAALSPGTNAVPAAPVIRVAASSPVHQEQLCELSLADGSWLREDTGTADVPDTFDGRPYRRQILWATSSDGTRVPMTLTSADDWVQARPTLVEVYGAYGHCAVRCARCPAGCVLRGDGCHVSTGCFVQRWHSAAAAAWLERGGGACPGRGGVWETMAPRWGWIAQAAWCGRPQGLH